MTQTNAHIDSSISFNSRPAANPKDARGPRPRPRAKPPPRETGRPRRPSLRRATFSRTPAARFFFAGDEISPPDGLPTGAPAPRASSPPRPTRPASCARAPRLPVRADPAPRLPPREPTSIGAKPLPRRTRDVASKEARTAVGAVGSVAVDRLARRSVAGRDGSGPRRRRAAYASARNASTASKTSSSVGKEISRSICVNSYCRSARRSSSRKQRAI